MNVVTINGVSYTKIAKLGQGAFGTVYKVTSGENEAQYALKEIIGPTDRSKKEFEIMNSMFQSTPKKDESKYIVKPIASGHEVDANGQEVDDRFYIVMEFVDGGDLEQYMYKKTLWDNLHQKYNLIKQIVDAISFMHEKDIIHGDLKFENILVSCINDTIKISDFGISCFNPKCNYAGGTRTYMDPMLLINKNTHLSKECDIYSLGVIFYEMLSQEKYNPRVYMSDEEIVDNFEKKKKKKLTDGIYNLIFNMLQPFTPEHRLTIVEIKSLLKDTLLETTNYREVISSIISARQLVIIKPQVIPQRLTRVEHHNRLRPFVVDEIGGLREIMGSQSSIIDSDVVSGVRKVCGIVDQNLNSIIRSVIKEVKAAEAAATGEGGSKKKKKPTKKTKTHMF
jgi:serine/threonine protein kinase